MNNGDYYNYEQEKTMTGSLLSLEEFSGEQNPFKSVRKCYFSGTFS